MSPVLVRYFAHNGAYQKGRRPKTEDKCLRRLTIFPSCVEPLAQINIALGQAEALPASSSVRVVVESRVNSGKALVTARTLAKEMVNFILAYLENNNFKCLEPN